MTGTIIKGIGGFYYVRAEDSVIYECKARGVFRNRKIKPVIGDKVDISVENGKGNITEIWERRTFLIRPPVSNIDNIMIVAAAKNPDPDTGLMDKMLVTAEYKGISPIICINKTDLDDGAEIARIYKDTGYPIVFVSTYEDRGTDELKKLLSGKITALAGLSGVGKSSILNALIATDAETGDISEKIKRGRHTTRHVELFEIDGGGYIFDTPGFSSYELEDIKAQDLCMYFPEMRNIKDNCRFKGCAHIKEPDCAVKEALFLGKISEERYESYKNIYEILKNRKDWE